jgi:hypothetical protein
MEFLLLMGISAGIFILCGSGSVPSSEGNGTRPVVVASTIQTADFARQIAGDRLVVKSIMAPGADPPTDQPAHDDVQMLIEADLCLEDGLPLETSEGCQLTEVGRTEANKVLRAHRLWKTYLGKIGTPQAEVHPTAHRLEHISDGYTVDYLDEKLGEPDQDPHGKSIPQ